MKIANYIDSGAKKLGGNKQLEEYLGLARGYTSDAKAGKRGLPVAACAMLADLIGADFREVVAASELATEKKEQRRVYWENFLERRAAVALLIIMGVVATPSPADAAPLTQSNSNSLYIMSNMFMYCFCSYGLRLMTSTQPSSILRLILI